MVFFGVLSLFNVISHASNLRDLFLSLDWLSRWWRWFVSIPFDLIQIDVSQWSQDTVSLFLICVGATVRSLAIEFGGVRHFREAWNKFDFDKKFEIEVTGKWIFPISLVIFLALTIFTIWALMEILGQVYIGLLSALAGVLDGFGLSPRIALFVLFFLPLGVFLLSIFVSASMYERGIEDSRIQKITLGLWTGITELPLAFVVLSSVAMAQRYRSVLKVGAIACIILSASWLTEQLLPKLVTILESLPEPPQRL